MVMIGLMTPKWRYFGLSVICDQIWLPHIMMATKWHNCVFSGTWLPTLCPDFNFHECIQNLVKIIWTYDSRCIFWHNMSKALYMYYFEVFCCCRKLSQTVWWGTLAMFVRFHLVYLINSSMWCICNTVLLVIVMICKTLSWQAQLLWIKLRRTWNLFYVLQEGGWTRVSSDHC